MCAVWCDSAGDPELMLPSSLRRGGREATGVARGLGIAPGPLTEPLNVLVRRRLGRRTPRGRSKSQLVRRWAHRPHAGRTSSHWSQNHPVTVVVRGSWEAESSAMEKSKSEITYLLAILDVS